VTGEIVEQLETVPPTAAAIEGPEWEEARREGCESPQELRLLKAIRQDGTLPEPEKQHVVWPRAAILLAFAEE
jgi:hypothetical protein